MLLRRLHFSALALPLLALACNDNTQAYPAIVIYGNPDSVGSGSSDGVVVGDGAPSAGGGNVGAAGEGSVDDHCNAFGSGPPPAVGSVQCDMTALSDGGELSGDLASDQTLVSGQSYRLKGEVHVLPGVTLTIQPCVAVLGETAASALVVLPGALGNPYQQCSYQSGKPSAGGKLIAVGEPMAPILFTSSKPKGQRSPGDWGGLYLMGNAQNNLAVSGARVPSNGLTAVSCHGWNTNELNGESSGQLAYARIEYAGQPRVQGVATSGLTLASVGSGTLVHHVMVSNSANAGFGFLGGALSADHLIALNANGDLFAADSGFSGKLQFLFGRQFPTTPDSDSHGIVIEGAVSPGALPRTSERISNFTLCGGGSIDLNPSRDGAALRHSASGASLMNGVLTGFAGAGLFVQTDDSNKASVSFVQAFGNGSGLLSKVDLSDPSLMGEPQSWLLNQEGNSSATPEGFCDCWSNPPVPVAASTARGAKPSGFGDESANYVGAFESPAATSNWLRGAWVDWSSR